MDYMHDATWFGCSYLDCLELLHEYYPNHLNHVQLHDDSCCTHVHIVLRKLIVSYYALITDDNKFHNKKDDFP